MKTTLQNLPTFTANYITAALWTFDDDAPSGEYAESGRPEELFELIAPETLQSMINDCDRFRDENAQFLSDYPDANAGQDFWLTRNGHGAGFWENDFGTEADCLALTKASKAFGTFDIYKGDDGKIHGY